MAKLLIVLGAAVLLVGTAAAEDSRARGYGIGIEARGWHVRITRGTVEASTAPLPPKGRWVASRLSRSLGPNDLGVLLFEAEPAPGVPFSRSVYREGRPRSFTSAQFGGSPLGGASSSGHLFARRNFTVSGRFFDLFVETGGRRPSVARIAALNSLVASLQVARGDFYPGEVAAARFRRAAGWWMRASPRTPIAPETATVTVASTVPYLDGLRDFPPHRTIAHLPPTGIAIVVQLTASNRDPPVAGRNAPLRSARTCGSFEGAPAGVAVCSIAGLRAGQYALSGWIVYGSPTPTAAMRRRADDELRQLVLPSWGRWR